MGGDPGEIEGRERSEKVTAVDGAQAVGEDEVVDDASPEVVGHAEVLGLHDGELFEAEERVGRQDEGPDLVEVGVGEAEGFEHGCDVGRLGDCDGLGKAGCWLGATGALPEGCFGIDVGEEGAGDEGEQAVEISGAGLRDGAWGDLHLGDGEVGGSGFGERPEEGVILRGGGEALCRGGQTASHAEGEAEVDGERKAGPRAEEGAGDGVEDCGVDEAFAGAEIVVGDGEVGGEGGFREGTDGFGVKGLTLGAEEEAGGGLVFLREFVGVEVVGGGEDPGGGGDCSWCVGDEAERTAGGELRGGVRCGDQDRVVGKGEGEVGERGIEGFLRERAQADEQAAGRVWRGHGVWVDICLGGGHRAIWTFSVRLAAAQIPASLV